MEFGSLKVGDSLPRDVIQHDWNWTYVLGSVVLSMAGSWRFLQSMQEIKQLRLVAFLPCGFVYGGCAVWSMHFTGMNSVIFGKDARGEEIRVRYHVSWLIASIFFPILSATFSSYIVTVAVRAERRMNASRGRRLERHNSKSSVNSRNSRSSSRVSLPSLFSGFIDDGLPWCGKWSCRRFTFSLISGLSMTVGIAGMHYTGFVALINIRQTHPVWGIGLVALAALVLNTFASWMACNPKRSAGYTIMLAFVISVAASVPHYISALSVQFYLADSHPTAEGLKGGPQSDIQDLIFVFNFITCTLVYNMWHAYRQQKKEAALHRSVSAAKLERGRSLVSFASSDELVASDGPSGRLMSGSSAAAAAGAGAAKATEEASPVSLLSLKFALLMKELNPGEMSAINKNFDLRGKECLTSSPLVVLVDTPRNSIPWSGCRTPELAATPRLKPKAPKVPWTPKGPLQASLAAGPTGRSARQWDVLKPLENWATPRDDHLIPERTSKLPWAKKKKTPRLPKLPLPLPK